MKLCNYELCTFRQIVLGRTTGDGWNMLLFIYGLFNDTTSKSDCIMLKDLMNSE
jgi:hypothetical protein